MALPLKPLALRPGDGVRIVSLASPVQEDHLQKGCAELARLGYTPRMDRASVLGRDGFFAGPTESRRAALWDSFAERETRAIFCSRGGYGTNYLLGDRSGSSALPAAKIFLGASDITSVQLFLWHEFRLVTFYGPMVASNFDRGAGAEHGYDAPSLASAVTETKQGWLLDLQGTEISGGRASGVLLGGCLTLVESSLGTPWELDTKGSIFVLEDRGMKPYQVDRALMHLLQAGKFRGAAGIVLGDFPECDPPPGTETVQDVARRILAPLGVPIVWGAPVGHTSRPMLTLPLGVQAELSTDGRGALRILEPACSP
jgi:muramoyltetrapeptide carboxypeptidase